MKSFLFIVSFIALTSLSFTSFSAAVSNTQESKAKQVVVDYFMALNNGDLDKIVSLYHKDSVFLPNNGPAVRGKVDIKESYRKLFSVIKLNTTHKYHHVSVSGNMAVVESKATGHLVLINNQRELPANDNELFILKKINGQWGIDRYMFNSSEQSH